MSDLGRVRAAVMADKMVVPPWWLGAVVVTGLAFVTAVVSLLVQTARHPRQGSPGWWLGLAALVGALVVSGLLALRPARGTRYGVMVLVLAPLLSLLALESGHGFGDPACALVEVGLAVVPALTMTAMLTYMAFDARRALAAGCATACVGLVTLQLTCPEPSALHVLAFHIAPYALVMVTLVVLRMRSRTRSFAP